MFSSKSYYSLYLNILLCIVFSVSSLAQKPDKNDLENKKKKIQEEIELTNQLLQETKKNKKLSLNQLLTLNKKIDARQDLIATINSQIGYINSQININNNAITALQNDLKKLKDEYAKMIYNAYKNRDSYNRLMFVFAAQSFDQAFLRLKYYQQYNDDRKHRAEQITEKQNEITEKTKELELEKSEKKDLLGNEQSEKETLTKEKSEKEGVLTELQSKEKQLKEDLKKKKKDADKLQQAIQRIIEDEIKQKGSAEAGSKVLKLVLTPEAQKLSSNFSGNKGSLPWPVIQGVIIDRFGPHPHPTLPEVTISNNGVDIATSKGALARAVFEGEVTGVVNIPSSGKVVIIRHGEYLSVYANLNDVYVKTGDKIKIKQNIGNILYNDEDGKTELHVEIWKGQTKLDPEDWLAGR